MSNRNHKKVPEKRRKERRYDLVKGCLGLLLLIAGIGMGLDTARLEEVPLWVTAGPRSPAPRQGRKIGRYGFLPRCRPEERERQFHPGAEIGRASCRERVYPVVYS